MDYNILPHNLPCSEMYQFFTTYRENVVLVLDMLEAVRDETRLVGDETAARFWTAISDAVQAFAATHVRTSK